MKNHLIAIIAGTLFGLGLSISQMINPNKVLAFLNITGQWDASLVLVMLSALLVTGVSFPYVLAQKKPLLSSAFDFSTAQNVNAKLILGSVFFGVGWGLAGYCPGPAIAALVLGFWEPFVFVLSMVVGSYAYKLFFQKA